VDRFFFPTASLLPILGEKLSVRCSRPVFCSRHRQGFFEPTICASPGPFHCQHPRNRQADSKHCPCSTGANAVPPQLIALSSYDLCIRQVARNGCVPRRPPNILLDRFQPFGTFLHPSWLLLKRFHGCSAAARDLCPVAGPRLGSVAPPLVSPFVQSESGLMLPVWIS
jgi:hypothetical protein